MTAEIITPVVLVELMETCCALIPVIVLLPSKVPIEADNVFLYPPSLYDKITFEKYTNILKIGLKNSGLGKIPQVADQVIVGDVDRSRSHKVKAIYVVGLNDGIFPSVNKELRLHLRLLASRRIVVLYEH